MEQEQPHLSLEEQQRILAQVTSFTPPWLCFTSPWLCQLLASHVSYRQLRALETKDDDDDGAAGDRSSEKAGKRCR